MLKEERKQKILDKLNIEQKVLANQLSEEFEVSEDTIRRDLKELSDQGLLKRVHKGALKAGPPVTDFTFRQSVSEEMKKKMAIKALRFIKEETVIIIDGSTTNLELVKQLPQDFKCTVITNSPPIAVALSHHRDIEVINLGGIFYKQSMISVGVTPYKQLEDIRADLYIMGVYNIDIVHGTSVPTIQEAQIKKLMSEVSTEVLAMITPDKFGTVSNSIIGPVKDISYLISEEAPQKLIDKFNNFGIKFID